MRILRHQIGIRDYQTIELPAVGEPLSVAVSRTIPNHGVDLWTLDHQAGDPCTMAIYVIGTGHQMPEEISANLDLTGTNWHAFIGTVVTPSGLVWHVFEGPVR